MGTDIKKIAEEMKTREIFRGLRVSPPFIVRIDLRNAKALSRRYFQAGGRLSIGFHSLLVGVGREFVRGSPCFELCFIHSDEISLVCLAKEPPYSGRAEKLDSTIAGEASSLLTASLLERGVRAGTPVAFDSRVIKVDDLQQVRDYLVWRQADCLRNAANWYAEAVAGPKRLAGVKMARRLEMLKGAGVELSDWARFGTLIYRAPEEGEAVNRRTGERVRVTRARICEIANREMGRALAEIGAACQPG